MVEAVLLSVVNIKVTSVGVGPSFGTEQRHGEGSGVHDLSRRRGFVTNNHVVEGAVEVCEGRVRERKQIRLTGTVVGTKTDHDIAVVKVDADEFWIQSEVGRSGDLQLGDRRCGRSTAIF